MATELNDHLARLLRPLGSAILTAAIIILVVVIPRRANVQSAKATWS